MVEAKERPVREPERKRAADSARRRVGGLVDILRGWGGVGLVVWWFSGLVV